MTMANAFENIDEVEPVDSNPLAGERFTDFQPKVPPWPRTNLPQQQSRELRSRQASR